MGMIISLRFATFTGRNRNDVITNNFDEALRASIVSCFCFVRLRITSLWQQWGGVALVILGILQLLLLTTEKLSHVSSLLADNGRAYLRI